MLSFFFYQKKKKMLSLSMVNVGKYDNFILLSLYQIFIFMPLKLSICLSFDKNILN